MPLPLKCAQSVAKSQMTNNFDNLVSHGLFPSPFQVLDSPYAAKLINIPGMRRISKVCVFYGRIVHLISVGLMAGRKL